MKKRPASVQPVFASRNGNLRVSAEDLFATGQEQAFIGRISRRRYARSTPPMSGALHDALLARPIVYASRPYGGCSSLAPDALRLPGYAACAPLIFTWGNNPA